MSLHKLPVLRNVVCRKTYVPLSPLRRRYATGADNHADTVAPSKTSATAGSESIPTWLYISTGSLLSIYLFYNYVTPTTTSPLSRYLSSTSDQARIAEERSNRHTYNIEEAAKDKHLFYNAESSKTVPLRFPEHFNIHSPYNHVAGQTRGRLMGELIAHYERENPKE